MDSYQQEYWQRLRQNAQITLFDSTQLQLGICGGQVERDDTDCCDVGWYRDRIFDCGWRSVGCGWIQYWYNAFDIYFVWVLLEDQTFGETGT